MLVLAVLQFRWIGQLSDAERERMERNVIVAASQFQETFDSQLRRAFQELTMPPGILRSGSWDRYALERYDQWISNAAHPQLIANIFLVSASPDRLGVELRQWNVGQRTFAEVEWPAALEAWRPDFEEDLREFNAGRPVDRRARYRSDSLLVASIRSLNLSPGAAGAAPQTLQPVFGFTILELDLAYVHDRILPELTSRHFTHSDADSYLVSVVTADDERRVIYQSDPSAPLDPAHTAATQTLFFGSSDPRFGPPRPGRDDGPGGGPSRRVADDSSRWQLLAQHRMGSLDAAVGGARSRNLATSFGVLLLLTLSIGLLTVTSRRAQRLAQQQMEFVAGVSHELRTPVAVIKSAAENLSQGVVGNSERVKRYGLMIEGEARRLAEMVERVLQYAGIESGLGYGAKVPLAPVDIINGAVDSARPMLGPESVQVHREIPDVLPLVVGDEPALRSAIQNLVANAVKYGGPDRWVGIRVEHVKESRRSEVRITVSDHGSGIPQEELPHIFEPFYRGGDALARQIHGNGLGLSLVKRIVAAHEGRVSVTTRAGAGSSFTIALPAAEPDSSARVAREFGAPVHP
jgi:signal transduction histidine kinase